MLWPFQAVAVLVSGYFEKLAVSKLPVKTD